jgi:hypothetical protein
VNDDIRRDQFMVFGKYLSSNTKKANQTCTSDEVEFKKLKEKMRSEQHRDNEKYS